MHSQFLDQAYKQAQKALEKGEVPIGCVITLNNKIIARAYNKKEQKNDCTAHAELLAIKKASKKLNDWRLTECILYSSCEPCAMCAAAILHARIRTVIYGVTDSKWGGESQCQLFSKKQFNHKTHHHYIEHKKSKTLLQEFFKYTRKKKTQ